MCEARTGFAQQLIPRSSIARLPRSAVLVKEHSPRCVRRAHGTGAHGVNANQIFQWRRLYRVGRVGGTPPALKLLPASIEASPGLPAAQPSAEPYLLLVTCQNWFAGTLSIR